MISVTLENLENGSIRVTGRVNNRTSVYFDGTKSDAKELVFKVLNQVARGHKVGSRFDMTYIEMNAEATEAMQSAS
jgi:hypothetical protein